GRVRGVGRGEGALGLAVAPGGKEDERRAARLGRFVLGSVRTDVVEHRGRREVLEDGVALGAGQERIQGRDGGACLEPAPESRRESPVVVDEQGDSIARPDTAAGKHESPPPGGPPAGGPAEATAPARAG